MAISLEYSVEWEVRKIVGTFPKKKRTPKIRKDTIVGTIVKPPQISSSPPPSTSQRKRRNTIDYNTNGHDENNVAKKREPKNKAKKREPKNKAKKRKINNGVCNNNKRRNRKVQILHGPAEAPPLPQETIEFIADKLGMYELQLLIQRKLFPSDVDRQQNRFSVPEMSLRDLDFMSRREWTEVAERWKEEDEDDNNDDGDVNGGKQKKMPIMGRKVLMVDTNLNIHFLDLKQWNLNSTISFMFTNKWSNIVQENQFKKDDIVQLWFFRDKELEPCFILAKISP